MENLSISGISHVIGQALNDSVGSVAATGAAAQMVEMIGGAGKLMAADNALLSPSLAKTAFSDITDIKSWWSGNGNYKRC